MSDREEFLKNLEIQYQEDLKKGVIKRANMYLEEYYRRESLPFRQLTQKDVPNYQMREIDSDLLLREDGMILSNIRGKISWVGQLDGAGGIAFDYA